LDDLYGKSEPECVHFSLLKSAIKWTGHTCGIRGTVKRFPCEYRWCRFCNSIDIRTQSIIAHR